MKAIVSDNNTETGAETVSFPKNDNPNQIIPKQERNAITNKSEQPVAIVTGASSGIGLGITQALLERGWSVVGTSGPISKSKDLQASPHLVLKKFFGRHSRRIFLVRSLTQRLLPLVRKSAAGRIVNVTSIQGSLTMHSDPSSAIYPYKVFAYDTSKTAINSFTIHLAHE